MTATYPLFSPDPRLKKLRRTYPTAYLYGLPPDPRRKSANLMVIGRAGPHGPLTVACCNGCAEKGRARPDGGCRHTDQVMQDLKPWWRARARPKQVSDPMTRPSDSAGRRDSGEA